MANSKKDLIKELSLKELQKQQKELTKLKEGFVKINGEDYKFKYDVFFRKTKQAKLVDELLAYVSEYKEDADKMELATIYATVLVIKHFTDIEIPDDPEVALEFANVLVDLGVLFEIINVLPEEEVENVFTFVAEYFDKIVADFEAEMAKVESGEDIKAEDTDEVR